MGLPSLRMPPSLAWPQAVASNSATSGAAWAGEQSRAGRWPTRFPYKELGDTKAITHVQQSAGCSQHPPVHRTDPSGL